MLVKIHPDANARKRASALRKRVEQVSKNFFGAALIRFYLLSGHDPEQDGRLPWMNLEDFYQSLGAPDTFTFKDCVQALNLLDFVRMDRKGKEPLIRLVTKEPKKEEHARPSI